VENNWDDNIMNEMMMADGQKPGLLDRTKGQGKNNI